MKTKLPEKVTIQTNNIFIAVMRFFEEYNKRKNDDMIECIITEMEGCRMVQSVWTDFETALTSVLLESDAARESDFVERECDI